MQNNTYLIKLGQPGTVYSVRVTDSGERQILFPDSNGEWIGHAQFVDTLCAQGEWDQVCELAKFGVNRVREQAGGASATPRF